MIARLFGPDRALGKSVRRARENVLDLLYSRIGMIRIVNGTPMRVHPRHRCHFSRDYDAPVARFLRERIRPGMTCVNVGANLGIYALQFGAWSAPDGRVIAFEPNPESAAVLRLHLEMNGLIPRARVVECAVSSESGSAPFHASGTDGMSRLGAPNPLLKETQPIQVHVITLDKFCEHERLRPDWVFMDIEGFEAVALAGFQHTIETHREMSIVVEMHPSAWPVAGGNAGSFRRLLDVLRLRPMPLTGQVDPMTEYGVVHMERCGT